MTRALPLSLALLGALAPARTPSPLQQDAREQAPADPLQDALASGEALLLAAQESLDQGERAEWPYEGVYRERGQIPPGYRVGGTALGARALLELDGWEAAPERRAAFARALEFVVAALERDERLGEGFSGTYDVRGWGQAYALELLALARERARVPAALRARVDALAPALVRRLEHSALPDGGWNYARAGGLEGGESSTFMTAAVLQALFAAARPGLEVDERVVARALDALEGARLEGGSFQYALQRTRREARGSAALPGAIGRMPIAEATLLLAGRGSPARVESSLEAFFEHWDALEARRGKSGTHAGPFAVAPYYFFFAHRYAAQAIELAPPARRAALRARLAERLAAVREADGSWNDRVFPRSRAFGTAMVLLALRAPAMQAPPGWPGPATR